MPRGPGRSSRSPATASAPASTPTRTRFLESSSTATSPQQLDRGPTITSTFLDEQRAEERARQHHGGSHQQCFLRARCSGSKLTTGTGLWSPPRSRQPPTSCRAPFKRGTPPARSCSPKLKGNFDKGQELFVDTVAGGWLTRQPQKVLHWFFVQDGGFPVDVEPALGAFRAAPAGRQRIPRRESGPGSARLPTTTRTTPMPTTTSSTPRRANKWASRPCRSKRSPTSSASTRGTPEHGMAEVSELGAQRTHRSSDAAQKKDEGKGDEPRGPWKLLPTQLDHALEKLKQTRPRHLARDRGHHLFVP